MRPPAIDPHECRCSDCLTGRSVPLNWADPRDVEDVAAGHIANRTGLSVQEIADVVLPPVDEDRSAHLIVYGASDDLIEVEGLISDESNPPYGKPAIVTVLADDAVYARLHVEYDPDGTGEWRIQPTSPGKLVTIVPARGEDDGSRDEHGCPGYSDKAVIDMQGIEARRVNVRCSPGERGDA